SVVLGPVHSPSSVAVIRPLAPYSTLFPYTTLFRSPAGKNILIKNFYLLSLKHSSPQPAVLAAASLEAAPLEAASPDDASLEAASDRKSTRLNSSHVSISYAVFCLKEKIQRIATYNI